MTQGQALRALNDSVGPRDWLDRVVRHAARRRPQAVGPGRRRALPDGGRVLLHGRARSRPRSACGWRGRDAGEVYVVIGDGTYLMGNTSELVTARQEGLKITVLVVENSGYQSIHGAAAQRAPAAASGSSSRSGDGEYVEVDYARTRAASAAPPTARPTVEQLRDALEAARDESGPVGDRRAGSSRTGCCSTPAAGGTSAWRRLSERAETRELAAEHARGRELQRFHWLTGLADRRDRAGPAVARGRSSHSARSSSTPASDAGRQRS